MRSRERRMDGDISVLQYQNNYDYIWSSYWFSYSICKQNTAMHLSEIFDRTEANNPAPDNRTL